MGEVVSRLDCAKRLSIRILSAMVICLCVQSAFARTTWKLIYQFDRSIGSAYFFDENHGLLGSGVRPGTYFDSKLGALMEDQGPLAAIYKTTDGGQTWTTSVVPSQIPGAVTQISMIDSLNGYASVFSDIEMDIYETFGRTSIWETTDGGSTWFDDLHLDHVATSVYAQNGLLLFTNWDYYYETINLPSIDLFGGAYSYDNGTTWNYNFRRGNGVAFSDSLNGVVSEMNSYLPGDNFWVTTDAGRTWQASVSNQYESWSVHAVRDRQTYFCANESQPTLGLPYNSINWSTDSGFTWSQRASFPVMHFTGDIEGVGNTLYFQTDSTDYGDVYQKGLYRSDDLGATWHWVGGPSTSRDSRFAVTGCEGQVVYAFDGNGGVWKTTDGGDGTLGPAISFDADTIRWLPNPCGDTLNFEAIDTNCVPVTIDSAHIFWGTELTPLPEPGILPATLQQNDSVRISVAYSPTKSGQQATIVRVFAHWGEENIYRDITIITTNTLTNSIALSKDTSTMSASGCASVIDSVGVFNAGCSGLVLDSVVMPSSDVSFLGTLPAAISDSVPFPLSFLYQPKTAEVETVHAHLYAHNGPRTFDTIITLELHSTIAPPSFVLDSTTLSISTKFCEPQIAAIHLTALSCDSVWIDSLVSSNPAFVISGNSFLLPNADDSLQLGFDPDSAGLQTGTIRIVAHSGFQTFDTTISVSGENNALSQAVTLSQTALTCTTAHCQPVSDTFMLANEGCDSLWLDSTQVSDDSEISINFDSTLIPLASNSGLPLHIVFEPQDGLPKASTIRLFSHTASRSIDTLIAISTSNNIPVQPLTFSTDSLYLFTKYCQPVSIPLVMSDSGCEIMTIDTEVVLRDSFAQFSVKSELRSISSNGSDTMSIQFAPNASGAFTAQMMVYMHEGGRTLDTVLSIAGKNLTAPVPYIPTLPSEAAGTILSIPIALEPTADTFSICHYAFHLSFNTDLLTPVGLAFDNTSSSQYASYTFIPEPGNGCSGEVWLKDTVSDSSQISIPLVYVLAKVSVAKDSATTVVLDSFATDREPGMELCSIPEQPFQLALQCGDPLLLDQMNGRSLSFSFISVAPNPGFDGSWNINYAVTGGLQELSFDVVNIAGERVYHTTIKSDEGFHSVNIPIPVNAGNYFITLGNGSEHETRRASVIR